MFHVRKQACSCCNLCNGAEDFLTLNYYHPTSSQFRVIFRAGIENTVCFLFHICFQPKKCRFRRPANHKNDDCVTNGRKSEVILYR